MIDEDGYRLNVGIVLKNAEGLVFWGKRKGEDSWQFPQGGIYEAEEVEVAMYRELNEELGLLPQHVRIIGRTKDWLYYDVPSAHYYRTSGKLYRGQRQIWYLLEFVGKDNDIDVTYHKEQEFDAWRWIDFWQPKDLVIDFKKNVYQKALDELYKLIPA